MLQRFIIALAQVQAGNTSENLLNDYPSNHALFVSSKRNY